MQEAPSNTPTTDFDPENPAPDESGGTPVPPPPPTVDSESPTVDVYNNSGKEPVLGELPHDAIQDGISSGKFSFPKGTQVPVISPEGETQTIDASEAHEAFNNGYRYAMPDEVDQAKYGSQAQRSLGDVEAFGEGLLGPIAPAAEIASGLTTAADIRGRERVTPLSGVDKAIGVGTSVMTGLGEGRALVGAAELATEQATKLFGKYATKALGKIGIHSIADATQMALYEGGNEVSKMIKGDPNQSAGTAIANVGYSALIGGVAGAALGTVSPLWKATVGDKLGDLFSGLKDGINGLQAGKLAGEGTIPSVEPMIDITKGAAAEGQAATAPSKSYIKGGQLANALIKNTVADMIGTGVGGSVGSAAGGKLGTLLGHPLVGAETGWGMGRKVIGPKLASVLHGLSDGIVKGIANSSQFKAALDFATAVAKGNEAINTGAKNIFKSALMSTDPGDKLRQFWDDVKPSDKDRDKLDKQLQALQQDNTPLTNVGGEIGQLLPDHGTALATTAAQGVNYLNNARPKPLANLPLDAHHGVNPVAQSQWNRTLDIAQQPLMVMHAVAAGRLTPQDVVTSATVNPGAHKNIINQIQTEMTNHLAKGGTIPYKTRMGLSMLLAQPLDSTMTPQGIMGAQPQPPQQQPATPQTPKQGVKRSTSKLGDMAKTARTASQDRESRDK